MTRFPTLAKHSSSNEVKKVVFFKDGDKNFGGVEICVSKQRYRSLHSLVEDLNTTVNLPRGIRTISTSGGQHAVNHITELEHGKDYVCSSSPRIKKMDYKSARKPQWNHFSKSKTDPAKSQKVNRKQPSSCDSVKSVPRNITETDALSMFAGQRTPSSYPNLDNSSMRALLFSSKWVDRPLQILYSTVSQRNWVAFLSDIARAANVPHGSTPLVISSDNGTRIESISQLLNYGCSSFIVIAWQEGNDVFQGHEPNICGVASSTSFKSRPEVTGRSSPDPPHSSVLLDTSGPEERSAIDATGRKGEIAPQGSSGSGEWKDFECGNPSVPSNVPTSPCSPQREEPSSLHSSSDHVDTRNQKSNIPEAKDSEVVGDTCITPSSADSSATSGRQDRLHRPPIKAITDDVQNECPIRGGVFGDHEEASKSGITDSLNDCGENPNSNNVSNQASELKETHLKDRHCNSMTEQEEGSPAAELTIPSTAGVKESDDPEEASTVADGSAHGRPIHFMSRKDRSSSFLSYSSGSLTTLSLASAAALNPGSLHMSGVRAGTPTSSVEAYNSAHVIKMKMNLPSDFTNNTTSSLEDPMESSSNGNSTKKTRTSSEREIQDCLQSNEIERISLIQKRDSVLHAANERRLRDTYEVGKSLSQGAYADILECTHLKTGTKHLVKQISKKKVFAHEDLIEKELTIMRLLNHPNILKLEDEFEDSECYHCILEYISGGDLYFSILECHHFCEKDVAIGMWSLGHALMYLHNHQIVHRGISAESLFISLNPNGSKTLKLGNFSSAIMVNQPLSVVCGSVPYIAPEMLFGTGYGNKVDLWAAGVLCYIMMCGDSPFNTTTGDRDLYGKSLTNKKIVVEKIKACQYNFPSPIWDSVSDGIKEFISMLLVASPGKRLSAEDMLRQSWLRSAQLSVEDGFLQDQPSFKSGTKLGFVVTALDKTVKDPSRTHRLGAE